MLQRVMAVSDYRAGKIAAPAPIGVDSAGYDGA